MTLRTLLYLVSLHRVICDLCLPYPTGNITVRSGSGDVSFAGQTIIFDFRISLSFSDIVETLQIIISSKSLQYVSNDTNNIITWDMINASGEHHGRNSSNLNYTEVLLPEYCLTFANVGGQTWSLQGTLEMMIIESLGVGDLVQSSFNFVTMNVDNYTCRTSVASEYFYLLPPEIVLTSETSVPVPMMGDFYVSVLFAFSDPLFMRQSVVEVRTPSEESSREVILTIQNISTCQVSGLSTDMEMAVRSAPIDLLSTYGSFQNDVMTVYLPTIERQASNSTRTEVKLTFRSRAEDYSQLRDGVVVDVGAGLQFGTDGSDDSLSRSLIWVSAVPVTLEAPPQEEKRPQLSLSLAQTSSCASDGEASANVELKIFHDRTSTATAYNITAYVYLPDATHVQSHTNSLLRENSLMVAQNSNVVVVNIARMTFSDSTVVIFDLRVNMTELRTSHADHHIVTAEVTFTDRWGQDIDMYSSMEFIDLNLDKVCSIRLTSSTSGFCACLYDTEKTDCACCLPGACQCGAINPTRCVPCQRMDDCLPYLDGFDAITEMTTGQGEAIYVCASYHRYKSWSSGISCYRKEWNGQAWTWTPINPAVGVILARDVTTGNLYGVSNNGRAHMRSQDSGITWYSMTPENFARETSAANLVQAKRVST